MKLIVGIGNPEKDYRETRHNTGYLAVDELQKVNLPSGIVVKKSDEFMNSSGSFVVKMLKKYNLEPKDLYIIHDDLDIPLGTYKIQFGRGPKDHNGILDIENKLGTKDFWRIRIGIDNRPDDGRPMGEVYTLENFKEEERKIIDNIISEICKKANTLLQ